MNGYKNRHNMEKKILGHLPWCGNYWQLDAIVLSDARLILKAPKILGLAGWITDVLCFSRPYYSWLSSLRIIRETPLSVVRSCSWL